MINNEQYKDLVVSHQKLIDNIVLAINESIKKDTVVDETQEWKTHKPWEKKVLPNLIKTQEHLVKAKKKLLSGSNVDARKMCSVVGGLGKDLDDFDTSWMDVISRKNIDTQLDYIVELADALYREEG